MKNQKMKQSIILVTTFLVCLMASSIIVSAEVIKNPNAEQGTVWASSSASYMSESNSAYSVSTATYGNLLNEDYAWNDPHGNNPERTGFNPGPAPDRADVIFCTNSVSVPKVILGNKVLTNGTPNGVYSPYVDSFSGSPMAMAGQLIVSGKVRVNINNSTLRNAVISLNPHTGAVNWASLVGISPAMGSVGSSFASSSYIYKVDDTHFITVGIISGGLMMFRTDGTFLWWDNSITAGAYYHGLVVAPAPEAKVFVTRSPGEPGLSTNYLCCYTLDNPEEDRNVYSSTGAFIQSGRSIWNYTIDEAGNTPIQCYGDGRVYMASYSSTKVYAIDADNGEKIWETDMPSLNGYMTCYAEGKLFVGCLSFYIHALNATNGEIIWQNSDGEANRAFNSWCMNYAYGRLYCHDLGFSRTGAMKCLDGETGKTLWASTELNNIGYYTTCVADGKVYGMQSDGSTATGREADPLMFGCWDAFTGEFLWGIQETISSPVIAYGCLYFILSGHLYAVSTAVEPVDWAMWRGSVETPGLTFSSGPVDISDGPKWTFTTGSGVISSPVISKGKLYINANDGYTYCINAYTGEEIWKHATNEPKMTSFGSTPAVVNNKVIIGPDDGNLYILNADNGAEIAKVYMGPYQSVQISLGQHAIRSSPIVYDNKIYVASIHDDKFYCLDLNGNIEWTVNAGRAAGSVGISNGALYLVTMTNRLIKMTLTGSIIWNVPIPAAGIGSNSYTPTIAGDYVYIGVVAKNLYAYNATNGELIFNIPQPSTGYESSHGSVTYVPQWTSASSTVGRLFGQDGTGMACMRADNGTNIWYSWGGWEIWPSPVVAGIGSSAVVYFGSDSGSIQVVDAKTGTPISWYTTGSNIVGSPAIWDGKLYVGSTDNKVYCFEDHNTQEMDISVSTDKTSLNIDDPVTVTIQLTKIPDVNVYEEIGRSAPVPGFPDADVLVTFTDPTGNATDFTATTDNDGYAIVTYNPDMAGTWKVIGWYNGEDLPVFSYSYAFSEELELSVAGPAPDALITTVTQTTSEINIGESVVLTVTTSGGQADFSYQWYTYLDGNTVALSGETSETLTVSPSTEGTYGYFCEVTDAAGQVDSSDTAQVKVFAEGANGMGIPMEYIYVIVAVIVAVIVLVVVYMVMKKRK
jgi:outer membrane protein assembly factor BamB